MSRLKKGKYGLAIALVMLLGNTAGGAIWEVSGNIGFSGFYAEMNDAEDIVTLFVRIENHAGLQGLEITPYFVQMTDANKNRCRPVTADEVVSDYLDKLRILLPQHQQDIDMLLEEIQADFPQEKIVKVYAKLKGYMKEGRPITWRAGLENTLLGKRHSTNSDIEKAEVIIEKINDLSNTYFWPGNIPPGESKTGILYFKRPVKNPASLFIQVGDDFLGLPFEVKKSDAALSK